MSEQPTPQAPPARRKPFAEQSFGDLLRSMALLLLFVAGVWAVSTVVSPEDEAEPVPAVDYAGQLATARGLADFRVVAPQGLAPGWKATSVDLRQGGGAVHWHLGFLTPAREYVGLEQSDLQPQRLVTTHAGRLAPAGVLTLAGKPWRLYRGETDTALVRRDGGVVTVVVGTATTDVLAGFVRSLG